MAEAPFSRFKGWQVLCSYLLAVVNECVSIKSSGTA